MASRAHARWYGACQLAGWAGKCLLDLILFAGGGGGPKLATLSIGAAALGLLETHLLRAFIRRHGWLQLQPAALAPRIASASLLLALVNQTAVAAAAIWGAQLYTFAQASGVALAIYVFQTSLLFLVWQLLYFGVHLVQRARRAELQQWQLRSTAQAAQLRYLEAQLNPHFLFNCLNSLRALIPEEPARAQQMVTQLASLLRYSLRAGDAQTVPLSRELEVVTDYLALESVRLEERLRVRMEVPEECRSALVPVMLLQSLVENAIKHGIAQLPAGGELGVAARLEGQQLQLEVRNPCAAASALPPGTGTGIRNSAERLRLLFGDQASIALDRSAPGAVTARVRIPLR